ncbi:MAG: lytic transglycosylase domain-containing protein [Acidobacteriota bacterium]|nr:lytic transglycosylase domain-containing protein [Acidobacteriota bacterium]
MRIIHLIVAASLAAPLFAGEYAVLANGSRLHGERHEMDGALVRLFSDTGVTEMASDRVIRFEAEEFVPPAPVPAVPAAVPLAAVAPLEAAVAPKDLAASAAHKYGLPSSFVQSVMKAESGFQPAAVSSKGAIGLMQLMPGTARTLGVDPANPKQNAEGGAQYLRELLAKYEDSPDQVLLALAAYNAGPGAVEHYHGVPPYRETREYILRILKGWDQHQASQ